MERWYLGRCCKIVHTGYNSHSCGNPGKVIEDGKVYCGIHNPEKVRDRNAVRRAKMEIENKKRERQIAYDTAKSDVINICKEWYKGACESIILAKAIKEMLEAEDKL